MISKKEFSLKLKKVEIKKIENIFRQIAEEKPYLIAEFKERKFYFEARKVLNNKNLEFEYVRDWLLGYRRRNNDKKIQ